MRSYLKMTLLTALICGAAAGAEAHPGSKILTSGGGARTAMTDGMSYEDVNGVHIFRGSSTSSGDAQMPPKTAHRQIEIEISVTPVFRRFRHLRTQGFYSGGVYSSRRYTHGFYSGR